MPDCLKYLHVVALVAAVGWSVTQRAEGVVAANDAEYLDQLQGSWDMVGSLGSKALHYRAEGDRALQGAFVRLHMVDANVPAQYEAELFVGFDSHKKDYIAHWIDSFGAPGARVVGQGTRTGSRLVITFPYTEGAFRDTFDWDAAHRSWSLLLESQEKDGSWSTFATYVLSRHADR